MMKRIIAVFLLIFLILPSSVTVYAAESSKLVCKDVSTDNNRLFRIKISINSDKTLTAATFIVKYDNSVIDYRSARGIKNDSTVKANSKSGKLKLIYLCSDGVDLSKGKNLFYIEFKAEEPSVSTIKIEADDCVNGKLKNFSNPDSCSCTVTVKSSGSSSSSGGSSVRRGSSGGSSSSDKSDDGDTESEDSDIVTKKNDSDGVFSDIVTAVGDNTGSPAFWICLVIVAIAFAVMCFYKLRHSKNEDKNPDKNDKDK